MKTYNLSAQPRTEIGKKASKLLRNAGLIPVGLIGGERVDLPYAGALKEGERVVDLGNNKGIIVTSLFFFYDYGMCVIYTGIFEVATTARIDTKGIVRQE